MACSSCGNSTSSPTPGCNDCGCNTPIVPVASSGSVLNFCATVQAPMPSPLPDNIPDTSVLSAYIKKCLNGNPVPAHDPNCGEATLDQILNDLQQAVFCVLNALMIGRSTGSCGILVAVNGSVQLKTLASLIQECYSCLPPEKICPGQDGDVLQTMNGVSAWGPLSVKATVDCASLLPALTKNNCIQEGGVPGYVIGYDAIGNTPYYYPYLKSGKDCGRFGAEFKIQANGGCITQDATPATYGLGLSSSGTPILRPIPSGVIVCADLLSKLVSCPPVASDPITGVLSTGASGVAYRTVPAATGTQLVPYHMEVMQAVITTPVTFNDQNLSTTFNTFNNLLWKGTLWESGLRASPSWYAPTTGKITIARAGLYRLNASGFFRMNLSGGGSIVKHFYMGLTLSRAAGTWQGTAYPSYLGVKRGTEVPIYCDGVDKDVCGESTFITPLAPGDTVWVRAVLTDNPSAGGQIEIGRAHV